MLNVNPNENKRQGDIFLLKIDQIPAFARPVDGHIIAIGEEDHIHCLKGGSFQLLIEEKENPNRNQGYLKVSQQTELVHESTNPKNPPQHKSLQIEEGEYMIVREREYDPYAEEIRRVQD